MTVIDFVQERSLRIRAWLSRDMRTTIAAMTEEELAANPFSDGRTKKEILDFLDRCIHFRSILQ